MNRCASFVRQLARAAFAPRVIAHALPPALALCMVSGGALEPAAARAAATQAAPRFEVCSDANDVEAIAVHAGRLYAATGGGVVAWDIATGRLVRKWTTVDGLLGNHAYAITVCPLPKPKVVVGTLEGLSLLDLESGRWESMTPGTSEMAAAAVTSLASDPERQTLYIGYAYAGVNALDGATRAWRHVATVNGLLANKVQGMALARDGRELWVAAASGISRVDARSVKVYAMRDIGTTSPLSGAIAADAPGSVWAITADGKLVRFARGKWKIYAAGEIPGAPLRPAAGLAESADGTLWFETAGGGICHFDPASGACTSTGRAPAASAARALLVAGGTLFVATSSGVEALDLRRGGRWRSFTIAGDVLGSNRIRALAEASDGTIWIGTDAGAYTIDPMAASAPWPAGGGAKITRVGKLGDKLARAEIHTLFPDPRGGMWMGTATGAARFDGTAWTWLGRPAGLVSDTVRAIARDAQGRMWFGTIRGLSIWDGSTARNLTARDGLPSECINALLAQGEVMYAGTDNSMLRFAGGKFQVLDDDAMGIEFESMRRIVPYRRDSLVIGSSNGLAFIDGKTGRDDPEVYGDAISALAVGPRDELWVGAELTGLFHRADQGWENFTIARGLPSNRVSALLLDRRGTVWIGTPDAGLARLVRAGARATPPARRR